MNLTLRWTNVDAAHDMGLLWNEDWDRRHGFMAVTVCPECNGTGVDPVGMPGEPCGLCGARVADVDEAWQMALSVNRVAVRPSSPGDMGHHYCSACGVHGDEVHTFALTVQHNSWSSHVTHLCSACLAALVDAALAATAAAAALAKVGAR